MRLDVLVHRDLLCELYCMIRVIDDHVIQNTARKALWKASAYDSYLDYDEVLFIMIQ